MSRPLGAPEPDDMETVIENQARLATEEILACLGPAARPNRIVYVYPGTEIAFDDCCGGQLSTRLARLVPHQTSGTAASITNPCSIDYWTATFQVHLLRCAATVDSAGVAPAPETITDNGLTGIRDMAKMLSALQGLEFVVSVTEWTPFGPEGGCTGSSWYFSTRVDSQPCD